MNYSNSQTNNNKKGDSIESWIHRVTIKLCIMNMKWRCNRKWERGGSEIKNNSFDINKSTTVFLSIFFFPPHCSSDWTIISLSYRDLTWVIIPTKFYPPFFFFFLFHFLTFNCALNNSRLGCSGRLAQIRQISLYEKEIDVGQIVRWLFNWERVERKKDS